MTGIRERIVVRTVLITSVVVALYFVATVIAGISLSYSPVPFADMWDGTLGFYLAHLNGDKHIWWATHNEHRIVLSRLLFWLDFKLANGTSILSLATHPVFAALSACVFYRFYQQMTVVNTSHGGLTNVLVASFLTAWVFQWMQYENFAWAFQSQFFMAQLLPLVSFYLLAKSVTAQTRQTLWFTAACVVGIASAGTMANGVICLPLMAVYSLVTRGSWRRILILVVLALVILSLYFLDFTTPSQHSSVTETILQQPLDLARYVLLYIGTPFFYLSGGGARGQLLAMAATLALALSSFYFLITSTRAVISRPGPSHKFWQLALVFYIIYLAGTALGTGGGRLIFGVNQALANRYTTPALMAWAAMFVLWLPSLITQWQKYRLVIAPTALVLVSLMIVQQSAALGNRQNQVFDRALAALVLELDIQDHEKIKAIYPLPQAIINTAETARRRQLSVFGQYPWRGLREQLGEIHQAPRTLPTCLGHVDVITPLEAGTDYRLVQGWLINSQTQQPATLITLVDQFNIIQGFALGGQVRSDVAAVHGNHGLNSGFTGYFIPPDDNGSIRLLADNSACELIAAELPAGAGEVN